MAHRAVSVESPLRRSTATIDVNQTTLSWKNSFVVWDVSVVWDVICVAHDGLAVTVVVDSAISTVTYVNI